MQKRILSAKWVLPITAPFLKDAGVVIEADKIIDVGKTADMVKKYQGAELEDFGRAIIMPGFIDLHTHLEFSAMRGVCEDLPHSEWKIQLTKKVRRLDMDDWRLSARLGAIEAVRSGITTIADMSTTGASLEAALELGIRGVVFYEFEGMDHSLVDSQLNRVKKEVERWQEMADNSNIKIGIAPHSPYSVCSPLIQATSDWAKEEKLKLSIHVAGSMDEHNFVKYGSSVLASAYRDLMGWGDLLWQPTGASPVKYLLQWGLFDNDVLAVHCVHVDEDDIAILKQHNVAIAHCPRCNAKLAMGIAPLRKFIDAGLRVGLGTDSPASNNTMDFFDEMRIGLLLQRGINQSTIETEAETFIHLATNGAAEALGMEKSIGSLTAGKQADIVVVDMSHSHQRPLGDPYSALVHTTNQEDIALTMVGGKILFSNETTKGLDADKVLLDIESLREKLR